MLQDRASFHFHELSPLAAVGFVGPAVGIKGQIRIWMAMEWSTKYFFFKEAAPTHWICAVQPWIFKKNRNPQTWKLSSCLFFHCQCHQPPCFSLQKARLWKPGILWGLGCRSGYPSFPVVVLIFLFFLRVNEVRKMSALLTDKSIFQGVLSKDIIRLKEPLACASCKTILYSLPVSFE